jgi:transposase-like protein
MEDKFRDVLNSIDAKRVARAWSPMANSWTSLRRQGFTCRDITALLAEKCQFKTSKSAVSRLVRALEEDGGMRPAKFRATYRTIRTRFAFFIGY